MAREVKKALNRPPTRKLVRWNDDLDELLLLTIQSVCNKEGVRLPWAEVAKSMGNNVTDGAIIQHLAKLRIRRVEKNKQVPPPLRRGGGYFGASKTSEAPVTPLSPKEKPEAVMERRANRRSQTKIKVEKGAARKITDISSDSDEEWTSDTPKTKKSKQRRPQKKRKITSVEPERLEPPVDDVASDDDATVEVTEASQRSDELVAVGADFLDFLGKNKAQEEDRAATPSEDEYQPDTNKSLIVTLKPGTNNMRRLKYKGTGVFQDRDPEQRWEMPAPGPNGEFWGFSRDYYGPIPQSAQHSHNPGLLRGEWPREVALRQYEAPQAVTWSNETYHPDPRLVHPAVFLEDPNCEPQLKFHRKLRTTEESNPGARVFDQGGPAYQSYANTHRELPTYRDSSWTTTPTHSYRHLSLRDSGYSSDFDTVRPKTEEKPDTHQLLDTKHTGTNDALVDRLEELPPVNKNYLDNPTEQLADNEQDSGVEPSAFDAAFESFLEPIHVDDISDLF